MFLSHNKSLTKDKKSKSKGIYLFYASDAAGIPYFQTLSGAHNQNGRIEQGNVFQAFLNNTFFLSLYEI